MRIIPAGKVIGSTVALGNIICCDSKASKRDICCSRAKGGNQVVVVLISSAADGDVNEIDVFVCADMLIFKG